jgi:hypothetical protein
VLRSVVGVFIAFFVRRFTCLAIIFVWQISGASSPLYCRILSAGRHDFPEFLVTYTALFLSHFE